MILCEGTHFNSNKGGHLEFLEWSSKVTQGQRVLNILRGHSAGSLIKKNI